MANFINERVYAEVASINNIDIRDVRKVMKHVSKTIADVIEKDDPNVSVKLDYIGNIYSNPERRKKIMLKKQEKENGRIAENRGGTIST